MRDDRGHVMYDQEGHVRYLPHNGPHDGPAKKKKKPPPRRPDSPPSPTMPMATSTRTATRTSTRAKTTPHHLCDHVHGADLDSDSLGLLPLADYNHKVTTHRGRRPAQPCAAHSLRHLGTGMLSTRVARATRTTPILWTSTLFLGTRWRLRSR
jgi:hypothetical protein